MDRIGRCGHCRTEGWTEGGSPPCDDSYCTFPYWEEKPAERPTAGAIAWETPTVMFRFRENAGLEQRWAIGHETTVVKYEWRPVPVVPVHTPTEDVS